MSSQQSDASSRRWWLSCSRLSTAFSSSAKWHPPCDPSCVADRRKRGGLYMKKALIAATVVLAMSAAPAFARGPHTGHKGAKTAKAGSDQTFVMKAAKGGMAEVELGKLAAQKGSSDQVKKFGQRMVDDHGKANDE